GGGRKGGVGVKGGVVGAEVQVSESRDTLVLAREGEYNAVARLNNAMGRNAGWPLEVLDLEAQPPLPGALADLLELAAAQRPEIALARQAVVAAQEGREGARAEFRPRIVVRGCAGVTSVHNVDAVW